MKLKEKNNDFYEQVWEVVKQIPKGRVTTYGAIARFLGTGKSARLVGYAMNASHFNLEKIPAHRVVNRLGLLTGKNHFPPGQMQARLEAEGIIINDDTVVDFNHLFWNPESLLK
jgi:methylated-DNA-protein-cysteine methyltransferase-like protein